VQPLERVSYGMRLLLALTALFVFPVAARADWPAGLKVVTADEAVKEVVAARGKVTLLVYWAAWCPDCRHELPDLEAYAAELGPKGLRVLSYSIDEDPAPLTKLLAQGPIKLDYRRIAPNDKEAIIRATRTVGGAYTGGIPYMALFDKSGKLVREWTRGKPVPRAEMEQIIKSLL